MARRSADSHAPTFLTRPTPMPSPFAATAATRRAIDAMRDVPNNVAEPERAVSVAIGAGLIALGVRRRDGMGVLAGFLGGVMVHRGASGHCSLYRMLGVSTGSAEAVLDQPSRADITGRAATVNARHAIKVEDSVTINRPRAELFAFWHDFEQLPRFMDHLVSVRVVSPTRSHWVAKGPAGSTVEWDAEIVNVVPDSIIAWKSVGHPDVANAGAVNFSDLSNGGTEVRVTLDYEPPGGQVGATVARLFGENPEQQVREELGRFKALMEARSSGQ